MEHILEAIRKERERQDAKFGAQNHDPFKWLAILGEEVGEANKAMLEGDFENLKEELVQIAAVAVAFREAMERNKS